MWKNAVIPSSDEPSSPFSSSARTVPRAQFSMGAHHRARALPAPKYYFLYTTIFHQQITIIQYIGTYLIDKYVQRRRPYIQLKRN